VLSLGRLDRRIILQRRSSDLSASGDPVGTWSTIATRWASVVPVRGTEQFAIPQITSKEIVEIGIRYSAATADLHPGDRVVFPSSADPAATPIVVYDILAVHELGRREGQKIIAERQPVPADEPLIDPLTTNPFLFVLPRPPFLFQDTGGLTPVWGDGQPVRRINELGPHGFIGLAPADDRRPIYRTDGTRHWLETDDTGFDIIVFSLGTIVAQPLTRISGWRRLNGGVFHHWLGSNDVDTEHVPLNGGPGGGFFTFPAGDNNIDATIGVDVDQDFVLTDNHDGANSYIAIDDQASPTLENGGANPLPGPFRTIFGHRPDQNTGPRARYYGHIEWTNNPPAIVRSRSVQYIASLQPGSP
jgi:SPP1 family predicted phage head-tail adaptor